MKKARPDYYIKTNPNYFSYVNPLIVSDKLKDHSVCCKGRAIYNIITDSYSQFILSMCYIYPVEYEYGVQYRSVYDKISWMMDRGHLFVDKYSQSSKIYPNDVHRSDRFRDTCILLEENIEI